MNARITDVTSLTARIARPNTLTGRQRQGQTTLFFAVETGRREVVKYLLDHGARVDVVDDMGRTPIDLAKGSGEGRNDTRSRDIVSMLTSAGDRSKP